MAELRSSSVTVDGITSPLIESGPSGSDEAVIFVHGSPGSSMEFGELVMQTGEFTRALAIDVPGFGQSDKPHPRDFEYSIPSIGIHVGKQLDGLGVGRAHFVGHDFGGGFSIYAGLWEPARVGSMTMINTGVLRGYRWHKWARIWRTPLLGELTMLAMNERGFKGAMRSLPAEFVDQMWRNLDRDTRRAILALYRATDHADATPSIPLLRALDWPALVIFGEDDPFIASRFAERNLEALPSASVHLLPNAGHWPFIDQPESFARLLLPFLRSQVTVATKSSESSRVYL